MKKFAKRYLKNDPFAYTDSEGQQRDKNIVICIDDFSLLTNAMCDNEWDLNMKKEFVNVLHQERGVRGHLFTSFSRAPTRI